ncbi:hypothetical protein L1887_18332 [Cichorium endivia]|nr:hypothetical protein L1887_18332 [Cichorium endivia]
MLTFVVHGTRDHHACRPCCSPSRTLSLYVPPSLTGDLRADLILIFTWPVRSLSPPSLSSGIFPDFEKITIQDAAFKWLYKRQTDCYLNSIIQQVEKISFGFSWVRFQGEIGLLRSAIKIFHRGKSVSFKDGEQEVVNNATINDA